MNGTDTTMNDRGYTNEERTDIINTQGRNKHTHRWLVFEGILFLIAGALALAAPAITVITVELFLGTLLLLSGIFQSFRGVSNRSVWLLLAGVLSISIGGWMLVMPISGAVAFATLIASFLIVEGFLELFLAYELRSVGRWGWLIASGVLSLILGIILLTGWPSQTLVLAGIFLGINFIFYAIALLSIAAKIDNVSNSHSAT